MSSQEELLAQQKANCPFCKIIAGEIPSKKVYEDEHSFAILDINPANKGHVLLLPKEHQFLVQLLPAELVQHLYKTARKLSVAMRKGLIVPKVTFFVANGPSAGQQSPHCFIHLIPREPGDGLDHFDLLGGDIVQTQKETIAQNTGIIMRNLPVQQAAQAPQAPPQEPSAPPVAPQEIAPPPVAPATPTHAQEEPKTPQEKMGALLTLLSEQPELHQLIIEHPEKVESFVATNPTLEAAFAGINIAALSQILKEQLTEKAQTQSITPQKLPRKEDPAPQALDVPRAIDLSDAALRAFIEEKQQLKQLLEQDMEQLHAVIATNHRLQHFFMETTPEAVLARLQEKTAATHDTDDDDEGGIDFDLLKNHL